MSNRIFKDSWQSIITLFFLATWAVGKVLLGRLLAEQLQLPFVDLDEYLTNKFGDSIPNLF